MALATDSTNHKTNCTKVVHYENWPGGRDRTPCRAMYTLNTSCSMNPWTPWYQGGVHAKRPAILPKVWLRVDDGGERSQEDGASGWSSVVEASEQIPRFCFELLPVCLNPPPPLQLLSPSSKHRQFSNDLSVTWPHFGKISTTSSDYTIVSNPVLMSFGIWSRGPLFIDFLEEWFGNNTAVILVKYSLNIKEYFQFNIIINT